MQDEHFEQGFHVNSPIFSGTLTELAYHLRVGGILPSDIDLIKLVRDYLAYYHEVAKLSLELATETLPHLARVIELKVRLLLPKPPKEEDEEEVEELLEASLEAIAILEELEEAIQFLRQRRSERRIVLMAKAPRPDYPRLERPIKVAIGRLAEIASLYRISNYFELAVERLTMAQAMKNLRQSLRQRRRGRLSELIPVKTWESLVMHFAGMLELVKEGKLIARQDEPYAEIELEAAEVAKQKAA